MTMFKHHYITEFFKTWFSKKCDLCGSCGQPESFL